MIRSKKVQDNRRLGFVKRFVVVEAEGMLDSGSGSAGIGAGCDEQMCSPPFAFDENLRFLEEGWLVDRVWQYNN